LNEEDFEQYRKHSKHIGVGGGLVFKCIRCGGVYDTKEHFQQGVPIWLLKGIGFAFTLEHTECEDTNHG
jgi:hypothetical protein